MPALLLPEVVARVADLAAPWQSLYAESTTLPAALNFAHLGGLLVGGGLALAADRQTLRAGGGSLAERARQLGELAALHRVVLAALALVVASGVALFLADVEQFAASPWYWGKMALVALLLANGALMQRSERALREGGPDASRWTRLRGHAAASAALWLAVTFAGVVLRES